MSVNKLMNGGSEWNPIISASTSRTCPILWCRSFASQQLRLNKETSTSFIMKIYEACPARGHLVEYYHTLSNCQSHGNCWEGKSTYEMKCDQVGNVK